MTKAVGLLIATLLFVTGCSAVSEKLPALAGRVVDDADLLDAKNEAALSSKLANAERLFGAQFVVVTVPSLGGQSIEDFTLGLGNAWGIGDAERDDGMILLVAPNERRVRIEVGYGLEGMFPDAICQSIIDEAILPHFKDGNMPQGINDGVDRILDRMRVSKPQASNDNRIGANTWMAA